MNRYSKSATICQKSPKFPIARECDPAGLSARLKSEKTTKYRILGFILVVPKIIAIQFIPLSWVISFNNGSLFKSDFIGLFPFH
jgi:hypothetical protein